MKIKKREVFLILLISLVFVSAIYSELIHQSPEVLIEVNGHSMMLKKAIENDYLVDEMPLPVSDLIESIGVWHTADEIIVSVNGVTKTLQEAIDSNKGKLSNKGLCSNIPTEGYNVNLLPEVGHLATNIELSSGKTLQQAIDDGDFCDHFSYSFKTSAWGSCSSSCGAGTQTRTHWCERENGVEVDEDYCFCATENIVRDKNYCVSNLPTLTQGCDAGDNVCGWSGWSPTTTCSVTGICSVGSYKRKNTCLVSGHCEGYSLNEVIYDSNGGACSTGGCPTDIYWRCTYIAKWGQASPPGFGGWDIGNKNCNCYNNPGFKCPGEWKAISSRQDEGWYSTCRINCELIPT